MKLGFGQGCRRGAWDLLWCRSVGFLRVVSLGYRFCCGGICLRISSSEYRSGRAGPAELGIFF